MFLTGFQGSSGALNPRHDNRLTRYRGFINDMFLEYSVGMMFKHPGKDLQGNDLGILLMRDRQELSFFEKVLLKCSAVPRLHPDLSRERSRVVSTGDGNDVPLLTCSPEWVERDSSEEVHWSEIIYLQDQPKLTPLLFVFKHI